MPMRCRVIVKSLSQSSSLTDHVSGDHAGQDFARVGASPDVRLVLDVRLVTVAGLRSYPSTGHIS